MQKRRVFTWDTTVARESCHFCNENKCNALTVSSCEHKRNSYGRVIGCPFYITHEDYRRNKEIYGG